MCDGEVHRLFKKSVWCGFVLAILMAVPVYGSAPQDDDAVYAYNQSNLFYAEEFFRSD